MGILFTPKHSIKYTIPGTYSTAFYNNRLLSQMYVYFYITSSPLAKQQNKSYVLPYYIYSVLRIRKIFVRIRIRIRTRILPVSQRLYKNNKNTTLLSTKKFSSRQINSIGDQKERYTYGMICAVNFVTYYSEK
jgi:hypothetical protein